MLMMGLITFTLAAIDIPMSNGIRPEGLAITPAASSDLNVKPCGALCFLSQNSYAQNMLDTTSCSHQHCEHWYCIYVDSLHILRASCTIACNRHARIYCGLLCML